MIVEAIETLRRRSLVERGDQGATFHAPIHGSRQSLRNARSGQLTKLTVNGALNGSRLGEAEGRLEAYTPVVIRWFCALPRTY